MAGDNVAINAGLALIKLIQAILELVMKVMDHKVEKLTNERDDLKHKLAEKEKSGKSDQKEIADLKDKIKKIEKKIDNLNAARNNANKMINEPGNVSIVNAINQVAGNKKTLSNSDIFKISDYLTNQAVNGLNLDSNDRESIRVSIEAAVRRTMPVEVPDNVHQALSQIDPNRPYNAATINQYINTNINNPNSDQSTLQGVQDIQQAFQDGRAVLRNGAPVQTDAQQMTYGKDLGKSKSMTMTFGGKSAAGTQQKSAVAHDEAK